jgi:hypothetical protein
LAAKRCCMALNISSISRTRNGQALRLTLLTASQSAEKRAYAGVSAPNALRRSVTVWRDRVQRPPHRHAFASFAASGVAQSVTVNSSLQGRRTAY